MFDRGRDKMRRWGLLLALVACQACATIKTETTVETVPLRTAMSQHIVPGSHTVHVEATVRRTRLDLKVHEVNRCDIVTSKIGQKLEHKRHSLATGANWSPKMSFASAGLAVGIGIYGIADAQGLADMSNQSMPDNPGSPDEYRATGGLLIGAGVGLAIVGIVDLLRLRDSTRNLGEVELSSDSHQQDCHAQSVASRVIEIELGKTRLKVQTDAHGFASLSLLDVPEEDLANDHERYLVDRRRQPRRDCLGRRSVRESARGTGGEPAVTFEPGPRQGCASALRSALLFHLGQVRQREHDGRRTRRNGRRMAKAENRVQGVVGRQP